MRDLIVAANNEDGARWWNNNTRYRHMANSSVVVTRVSQLDGENGWVYFIPGWKNGKQAEAIEAEVRRRAMHRTYCNER